MGTRLESEGGADTWERPPLQPINESKDSIGMVALDFF